MRNGLSWGRVRGGGGGVDYIEPLKKVVPTCIFVFLKILFFA